MSYLTEEIQDFIKDFFSGWLFKIAGSFFLMLLGAWKIAFTALIVLMFIDFLLAVSVAINEKRFDYRTLRDKTIIKLATRWGIIIAAHQLNLLGLGNGAEDMTILYMAIIEFASIVRHASTLSGSNLNPFAYSKLLKQLKEDNLENPPK